MNSYLVWAAAGLPMLDQVSSRARCVADGLVYFLRAVWQQMVRTDEVSVAILTIVDRSPVGTTRRSQKSAFSPQSIVWARALPTARAGFLRGIEKSLGNTVLYSFRTACRFVL